MSDARRHAAMAREGMARARLLVGYERGAARLMAGVYAWFAAEAAKKLTDGYDPTLKLETQTKVLGTLRRIYSAVMPAMSQRTLGLADGAKCYRHAIQRKDAAYRIEDQIQRWTAMESFHHSVFITDTMFQEVLDTVVANSDAGLSQDEMATEIRKKVGLISRANAARIARTEVHGSAEFANQAAMETVPSVLEKQWVAVADMRTREDHTAADGQTIPLDASFRVGGDSLRFPGDPLAPPGQTINCRCASLPPAIF